MAARRINHVSVVADDLETSARFYEELFGLERLPTPVFPDGPVLWLRAGDQQLHLFERDTESPRYHHVAFDVDDFDQVFVEARDRGILDAATWGAAVREHPAGWAHMYLRDPAGNLVEVVTPDAAAIDRSVVTGIVKMDDAVTQTGAAADAVLHGAGR